MKEPLYSSLEQQRRCLISQTFTCCSHLCSLVSFPVARLDNQSGGPELTRHYDCTGVLFPLQYSWTHNVVLIMSEVACDVSVSEHYGKNEHFAVWKHALWSGSNFVLCLSESWNKEIRNCLINFQSWVPVKKVKITKEWRNRTVVWSSTEDVQSAKPMQPLL